MGLKRSLGGGPVGVRILATQPLQPHDDPGRAEPALTGALGHERVAPHVAARGFETLERRHAAAGDPAGRRDTRDSRCAVDQHRAATALALRTATVLGGADPQVLAQQVEQRDAPIDHRHRRAVDDHRQLGPAGLDPGHDFRRSAALADEG
jgi:hypothetical protein